MLTRKGDSKLVVTVSELVSLTIILILFGAIFFVCMREAIRTRKNRQTQNSAK